MTCTGARATLIAVGSCNPAKVEAARGVFCRLFEDVRIVSFEVDSGVPAQPVSEEVFEGAVNRAAGARSRAVADGLDPDYSVGVEAGIVCLNGRWCAWGAASVIDRQGVQGIGTTPAFQLPQAVVRRIREGDELSDIMEAVSGDAGIRHGRGAVGLFTRDLLTRQDLFESGIMAALAPHLSPEWYP